MSELRRITKTEKIAAMILKKNGNRLGDTRLGFLSRKSLGKMGLDIADSWQSIQAQCVDLTRHCFMAYFNLVK